MTEKEEADPFGPASSLKKVRKLSVLLSEFFLVILGCELFACCLFNHVIPVVEHTGTEDVVVDPLSDFFVADIGIMSQIRAFCHIVDDIMVHL